LNGTEPEEDELPDLATARLNSTEEAVLDAAGDDTGDVVYRLKSQTSYEDDEPLVLNLSHRFDKASFDGECIITNYTIA